ncbi:MAG TPA: MAPEG family protein [Bauldia sp.]|nr:MAPEG family protein [Bauldia sp.]
MSLLSAFAPIFVQVALTFALLFWTGSSRIAAIQSGVVKMRDVALRQPNWPERTTQISNAYQSQLELPVLFYVLVVLAFFSAHMTATLVVLSWLFVASRLLHALVHVTTNEMRRRFYLFVTGAAILLLMWVLFLLDVMFGGF